MIQLGPYTLQTPYVLAPMAGVSELPFRRLALELGAGLAPTELVSAEGLLRRQPRTLAYLRHDPRLERPFCVQLFGGDPERMAFAAQVAKEQGAQLLDLNMGCPVPKVTKNGAGSALMRDPERAAALVRAVREATGLPVSCKFRSGWDSTALNAPEFAVRLEGAGACALAVHARTRVQGYSGKADWKMIAQVKRAVRVPVIGNGDVCSRADAERMVAETGCDGVMVGRGALGNPWVFRELCGGEPPTPAERLAAVKRHLEEHLALFDQPRNGIRAFRKLLLWYARGLRGASTFRTSVMHLEEPAAVTEAIERYFATAERDGGASGPDEDLDLGAALG